MGTKNRKKAITSGFSSFCHFLYNKKNGTVLGRGGKSWLQIGVFYILFYSGLALFWSILLYGVLNIMDNSKPFIRDYSTPLQLAPGLTRVPNGDRGRLHIDSAMYNDTNSDPDTLDHVKDIYYFLNRDKAYNDLSEEDKMKRTKRHRHIECEEKFNNDKFYGYDKGSPVILLKINKIYGWIPENSANITCELKKNEFDQQPIITLCPPPGEDQIQDFTDSFNDAGEMEYTGEYDYSMDSSTYRTQFVYLQLDVANNYGTPIGVECKLNDADENGPKFEPRFEDNYGATSFYVSVKKGDGSQEVKVMDDENTENNESQENEQS